MTLLLLFTGGPSATPVSFTQRPDATYRVPPDRRAHQPRPQPRIYQPPKQEREAKS
jgi:hypothetical protein